MTNIFTSPISSAEIQQSDFGKSESGTSRSNALVISSRIAFLISPGVSRPLAAAVLRWLLHSGRRWKSGKIPSAGLCRVRREEPQIICGSSRNAAALHGIIRDCRGRQRVGLVVDIERSAHSLVRF